MKALKKSLRVSLKDKLKKISSTKWNQRSKELSLRLSNLLNHLEIHQAIGAFAPLHDEVRWHLAFDLSEDNFGFPSFEDGKMVFRLCKFHELEAKNDFGVEILGPRESAELVRPSVLLVPGLGFCANGNRLGRGKGFYRYLDENKTLTIGLCLQEQIVEEIPREDHDMKVEYVVTDQAIYSKGTKLNIGE